MQQEQPTTKNPWDRLESRPPYPLFQPTTSAPEKEERYSLVMNDCTLSFVPSAIGGVTATANPERRTPVENVSVSSWGLYPLDTTTNIPTPTWDSISHQQRLAVLLEWLRLQDLESLLSCESATFDFFGPSWRRLGTRYFYPRQLQIPILLGSASHSQSKNQGCEPPFKRIWVKEGLGQGWSLREI